MRSALLVLLAPLAACLPGWKRAELGPATWLPPEQHVQVWVRGGGDQVLHAVRVDTSGVSGVPWRESPECHSCRVVYDRAEIDSVRIGNLSGRQVRETATWVLLLLTVVTVAETL